MQYDGAMNGELFERWMKDSLCPALSEGSAIVMDNASFRRKEKVERIAVSFGQVRDKPQFCVNSICDANRTKFIHGVIRLVQLPPC